MKMAFIIEHLPKITVKCLSGRKIDNSRTAFKLMFYLCFYLLFPLLSVNWWSFFKQNICSIVVVYNKLALPVPLCNTVPLCNPAGYIKYAVHSHLRMTTHLCTKFDKDRSNNGFPRAILNHWRCSVVGSELAFPCTPELTTPWLALYQNIPTRQSW